MEVRQTQEFRSWLTGLRDLGAANRIAARIRRLELGNPGDAKSVGEGVSEMRVDYGPGYRIYFTQSGSEIFILLCGGDKRTQSRDIQRAKKWLRKFDHAYQNIPLGYPRPSQNA